MGTPAPEALAGLIGFSRVFAAKMVRARKIAMEGPGGDFARWLGSRAVGAHPRRNQVTAEAMRVRRTGAHPGFPDAMPS